MRPTKRYRVWLQAITEYVEDIDAVDKAAASEKMRNFWFDNIIEPYDEHSGTVVKIVEIKP